MEKSDINWASDNKIAWELFIFSIVMPGIAIIGRNEPGIENLYIWLFWLPIQLMIIIYIGFVRKKERTVFDIDNIKFITLIENPLKQNGYSIIIKNKVQRPIYPVLRPIIFNYILIVSNDSNTIRIYIDEKDKIMPSGSSFQQIKVTKIYIGPIEKSTIHDVRRIQSIIYHSVENLSGICLAPPPEMGG